MSSTDSDEDLTPPLLVFHRAGMPSAESVVPNGKPTRTIHVLLIEDNPGDAQLIREYLDGVSGLVFDLACANQLSAGLACVRSGGFDVVLLDLSLPDSHGLDTFTRLHEQAPALPIIVLSGLGDERVAVAAVQMGAEDYLVKGDVNTNLLVRSLRYAIERTRRRKAEHTLHVHRDEFRVARQIQQKLFPAGPPPLAGFDIGGASYPAVATGGDYFDYLPMPGDSVGVVIGDVTGHGFGPALLMATLRAYLRALTRTRADVGEILTLANHILADDVADDRFITAILGRLDPAARSFAYASAGHSTAYHLDAAGRVKTLLISTALPLGIAPDTAYVAAPPLTLEPGDMIFLLTDGLFEACPANGQAFGIERVLDLVRSQRERPAREIVKSLYESVHDFCHGEPQEDDITAIIIKVRESC